MTMPISIDTKDRSVRSLLWFTLITYMILLTKFVLFKKSPGYIKNHFLHHYSLGMAKSNLWHGAHLVPFHTVKMYLADNMPLKYAVINLAGNFLGFMPLAILLPLLFNRLRSASATILCVFLVSLGFEIFQLITLLGVCDIDDLILNTMGGIAGYMVFWFMTKFFVIH
ncbi:hypothetical protein BH11BAC4_BH11BAC4_16360 [soil metagenome]